MIESFNKYIEMTLWVVELSGEGRWQNPETADDPKTIVKAFFDWQFQQNAFDYAVVCSCPSYQSGILKKIFGRAEKFLSVCMSTKYAKQYDTVLMNHALRGFELIVATQHNYSMCCEFFRKFGYVNAREYEFSLVNATLPGAWNKEEINDALLLAIKLGGKEFCCFGHDADPIYLIFEKMNKSPVAQ